MLARNRLAGLLALTTAGLIGAGGCAHRAATCGRTCDEGFACVAGECLKDARLADVEALDKFGTHQTRRLVIAPVDVARLARGSPAGGQRVATLGRDRDAEAVVLLRFDVELPPGASVVRADLVFDRDPSADADTSLVTLHAARIAEPWDVRALAWGRAPRIDEVGAAVTNVSDARAQVRLDVRPLVRRWRRHAPDDQGIAVVADRSSATGLALALADGNGASEANAPVLSIQGTKDAPPVFHAGAEEPSVEAALPRSAHGPRLELYVKP